MMRMSHILLFLLLAAGTVLNGQYTKEFKRIFFDADYLYETAFYEEAFNRYNNLLTLDPGNSNILFHCGACCLNIPGREVESITYLQEATGGVSDTYKEKSHKEAQAPVMTYFFLGKAYHLDYQFPEAIENYNKYVEQTDSKDVLQLEYISMQIEACKRAEKIEQNRPTYEFQNVLDHFDDELPSCSNPVISGDGNILIFLVDYPSDKKIMMTRRTGELWSRPRVINSEIGMVGETYPVSLSYDGMHLYMAHHFYSHSDIFVSHYQGDKWGEAQEIGYNINGRTSESHASISRDGTTLYFTSDVRGGSGSFDIYVSRLDEKGEWGAPKNLGPVINTQFEEHTPFISENDSILFFSSQGHASLGGLDVFFSMLQPDGSWGTPVNMGYPVSNPQDNLFFNPGWNKMEGYYAVSREDDPASKTINIVMELEYPEEMTDIETQESEKPREVLHLKTIPAKVEPAKVEPTEVVSQAEVETSGDTGGGAVLIPVIVPGDQDDRTESAEVPDIESVLEPENTDEVEDVLNQGRGAEETQVIVVPVASKPATVTCLSTAIPFAYNAYELSLTARLKAEKIADLMTDHPDLTIDLVGRADAMGSNTYNMLLSEQRADQIASYLVLRGIDPSRITSSGLGETAPVARNQFNDGSDAPLGRYLNRQVYATIHGTIPAESGLESVYVPANLKADAASEEKDLSEYQYTIQLKASYGKAIPLRVFEGLEGVKEYHCSDGYFRYTKGSFREFNEAREEAERMKELGHKGAFIQTLTWYDRMIK